MLWSLIFIIPLTVFAVALFIASMREAGRRSTKFYRW